MSAATIFKGFNIPVEDKSLIVITKDIKEGKYREEVQKVTALFRSGNLDEAETAKKSLMAFTPSATYKGGRKPEYVTRYSHYIVLDLDKLSQSDLETAFQKAVAVPYTFCCFRSPSGCGLKILAEVTSPQEHHLFAYNSLAEYYQHELALAIDRSGKDITRLCFVGYDPEAYRTISNEKFHVRLNGTLLAPKADVKPAAIQTNHQPAEENQYSLAFDMQVAFTNQKTEYGQFNRNNYIYLLACNCNRAGIPEQDTLALCLKNYDLKEKEVKASVNSAYGHHEDEFAKFANLAILQSAGEAEDYLKGTPTIPEDLFHQMPEIIRSGALAFGDIRERDVFTTGALGILSGCLPNVKGVYAQQEVFPNLFTFIIAPAASGKGALKFAKQLADEYDNQVSKSSREAETKYHQEELVYKQMLKSLKRGETISQEPPERPPFKVVYIPANTSYAKILWHLQQNEGAGIICETEADTLGNVFKQEWGSYSDMLRKSFHHERISCSRKTNNEFTVINEPCLSIALSGTPNQVAGLIASAEDGLFSRFLFYAFKVNQQWNDVSPYGSAINLTSHFRQLSLQVFEMVKFLKLSRTFFDLSREQWGQLNSKFANLLTDVATFTGEDAASVVKRLGLVTYRVAMLFTALRKYEAAEVTEHLTCSDIDFNTAIRLTETYLQHSLLMFNNLPRQEESNNFKGGTNKRKFFEALPGEFTRNEAVALGQQYTLSPRTVDYLLQNATPSLLTKLKPGLYRKV